MSRAKDYLLNIARLDAHINMRISEKEDLMDKATHITPTLSTDKGSGGGFVQDKIGGLAVKLADLEKMIDAEIDHYVDLKREAVRLLDNMENPVYMTILERRYLLHQTFEKIATDMNYTYRWVTILHGRALQSFDKMLENSEV